jgi:hypothetical protein
MKSLFTLNELIVGTLIVAAILLAGVNAFAETTASIKTDVIDEVNMVIDMAHFNQMKMEMSYAQLEKFLGVPTLFYYYVPDDNSDAYVWEFNGYAGKESYAVILENDHVVSTHYSGKNFDISYGSDLTIPEVEKVARGLQHPRFHAMETTVARDALGVPHPPKSAFEMIDFDMTYLEVADLLGKPRMRTCTEPCMEYVWNVEDVVITVNFLDEKVISKDLKTKDYGVSVSLSQGS